MPDDPFFSVVLSTYGRSRHIEPTILSILSQTFKNYELIVVGDGCRDETEEVVNSFSCKQIKWLNLCENSGSQSFPNNAGIAAARGRWIAYVGHDDLWAPHHLEMMSRTIALSGKVDFVIAGCVYYGPPGSDVHYVTGLFEGDEAPFTNFFPPTSIAHHRDVTERIGGWRDPLTLNMPLDVEFLMRAALTGMHFVSTGNLSVHKFAAGHRYLSYLRVSSDEQWDLLPKLLNNGSFDAEKIIRRSKENNQFMIIRYGDFSSFSNGLLFEQNRRNKGISRPALQPLLHRTVMNMTDDPLALDWYGVEMGSKKYRWSGPNPHPKILIPYTGHRAKISIELIAVNPALSVTDLRLYSEDGELAFSAKKSSTDVSLIFASIYLKPNDYTILSLDAPTFRPSDSDLDNTDLRRLGVAVGDIVLEPLGFVQLLFRYFRVMMRSNFPVSLF